MCMCVLVCVCVCAHTDITSQLLTRIHICPCIYMYTYMSSRIYVCVCVHIQISPGDYWHVYMYAYTYMCIYMSLFICVCGCVYTHRYYIASTDTYMWAHTSMCICICHCVFVCVCAHIDMTSRLLTYTHVYHTYVCMHMSLYVCVCVCTCRYHLVITHDFCGRWCHQVKILKMHLDAQSIIKWLQSWHSRISTSGSAWRNRKFSKSSYFSICYIKWLQSWLLRCFTSGSAWWHRRRANWISPVQILTFWRITPSEYFPYMCRTNPYFWIVTPSESFPCMYVCVGMFVRVLDINVCLRVRECVCVYMYSRKLLLPDESRWVSSLWI